MDQLMRQYDRFVGGIQTPSPNPEDAVAEHIIQERREKWLQHLCTQSLLDFLNAELIETAKRIDALAFAVDAGPQIQLLTVKQKTLNSIIDHARRI